MPENLETMHDICLARFGDEIANHLISSFTRGVFAADARQLSMKAAFPAFWKLLGPKHVSDDFNVLTLII